MKKCHFCAEEIQDEAKVCRHCLRTLPVQLAPSKPAGPVGVTLIVAGVLLGSFAALLWKVFDTGPGWMLFISYLLILAASVRSTGGSWIIRYGGSLLGTTVLFIVFTMIFRFLLF